MKFLMLVLGFANIVSAAAMLYFIFVVGQNGFGHWLALTLNVFAAVYAFVSADNE